MQYLKVNYHNDHIPQKWSGSLLSQPLLCQKKDQPKFHGSFSLEAFTEIVISRYYEK